MRERSSRRAAAVSRAKGLRRHRARAAHRRAHDGAAALPSLPSVRVADRRARAVERTRRRASERHAAVAAGEGEVASPSEIARTCATRSRALRAAREALADQREVGERLARGNDALATRVAELERELGDEHAAAAAREGRAVRDAVAAYEATLARACSERDAAVRRANEAKASLRAALALAEGELHKELAAQFEVARPPPPRRRRRRRRRRRGRRRRARRRRRRRTRSARRSSTSRRARRRESTGNGRTDRRAS